MKNRALEKIEKNKQHFIGDVAFYGIGYKFTFLLLFFLTPRKKHLHNQVFFIV